MAIKHLEVKRAYYNDPENVVVETKSSIDGNWYPISDEPKWLDLNEYRIKPKTIRIGDIDVPEPVREELEIDELYFVVDGSLREFTDSYRWKNDELDNIWLSRGLIHLTREAAELHAKALILVSGGTTDGIDSGR